VNHKTDIERLQETEFQKRLQEEVTKFRRCQAQRGRARTKLTLDHVFQAKPIHPWERYRSVEMARHRAARRAYKGER